MRQHLITALEMARTTSNRYVFDRGYAVDRAAWVVGDGRSGTTWVSELINFDHSYRYLFEPFHPFYVRQARPFAPYLYRRPDDPAAALRAFYEAVFSGRFSAPRVDRYNRTLTFYRRRLVKDVFANLLVGWVDQQFPSVPKVLVMRHPFAVAVAKQKLAQKNYIWADRVSDLLDQRELVADHLAPFRSLIAGAKSYFEAQVLFWAVAHYVPLRQLHGGRVLIVFYEELYRTPDVVIRTLLEHVRRPVTDETVDRAVRRALQPSKTTDTTSALTSAADPLSAWKKELSARQVTRGLEILRAFGLDAVYGDDPMPQSSALVLGT